MNRQKYFAEYRQKHREERKQYNKKYRQEHLEQEKKYGKKYQQEHKKEANIKVKRHQQKRKHFTQELKGNGCAICGYNKCPECLVFHHVNPEDKKFQVSDGIYYGIEKVIEEINKCILLCKNCHGEIHYKEKREM